MIPPAKLRQAFRPWTPLTSSGRAPLAIHEYQGTMAQTRQSRSAVQNRQHETRPRPYCVLLNQWPTERYRSIHIRYVWTCTYSTILADQLNWLSTDDAHDARPIRISTDAGSSVSRHCLAAGVAAGCRLVGDGSRSGLSSRQPSLRIPRYSTFPSPSLSTAMQLLNLRIAGR